MNWGWVIRDQLATGSMPLWTFDADTLDNVGITHVLNVADDKEGDREYLLFTGRGISYRRVPIADTGAIPPDWWWQRATDWALEVLGIGGTLYVHCLVGSARGPSMAYAILLRLGWTHGDAIWLVRQARSEGSLFYVRDAADWFARRAA